jgi:hypothetical protein
VESDAKNIHRRGGNGTLIALTLARGSCTTGRNQSSPAEVPIIWRSENGGVSWGPSILPFGQPKLGDRWLPMQQVYDTRTARMLLTLGNGTQPIPHASTCESHGVVQLSSIDRGLHWSSKVENISSLLLGETSCLAPTGGIGLQLREGSPWAAGRILWAMAQNAYQGDVIVWSDDGGQSYNHSDTLHSKGLDEWQMVELNNHSTFAIIRNCANASGNLDGCHMLDTREIQTAGKHLKAVSLSTDGGNTFSKPWLHPDLVTPICNSAIINYDSSILFSGPYSESTRHNLTVLASSDGGNTFSKRLVLVPGSAGYSSIACGFATVGGASADCAVLFKASDGVCLVRFRSSDIIGTTAADESPARLKTDDTTYTWRARDDLQQLTLAPAAQLDGQILRNKIRATLLTHSLPVEHNNHA